VAGRPTAGAILRFLQNLDRRWIFLLVGLGTILPILYPIGFPVSVTPPVQRIFDAVEKLGPDDVVLVSFDYGPTTRAENAPMAAAVVRHCFARGIKVVALALYPTGGAAMAHEEMTRAAGEFPGLRYGIDYVNLGYKDGGQAMMKQMGEDIHAVYPSDAQGRPLAQLPLMQRVHNYSDVKLVVSLATGIIGEWWANLINAQFGTPVAVGCTAVSAPKYYAYLDTGQMLGLLGGLKGASEYEELLLQRYPRTRQAYDNPAVFSARKGMDVQTIDHAIIILFILIGNAAFLTLCLFSFLYKDNPFFRLAEALFAGVSLAYYIGQTADQTIKPNLILPLIHDFRGNWDLLLAALIGLNLFNRYIPRISWLSRISLAIYVGYYTGINMVQKLQGEVLPQSGSTMLDLLGRRAQGGPSLLQAGNALIMVVGVLAVLVYFFFSVEHKGVVGKVSRIGIWYLMLGFGAAFGYTVMGRVSLLIGRVNFLITDWIGGTLRLLISKGP
jgi:hypothetical protein